MSFLEVESLSKNFAGLMAIKELDFKIEQGEIMGLIGPNGAGKTTLFNMINGFFPPTRGEIRFHGKLLRGMRPHQIVRKGITKTFQIPKPFMSLTCAENIRVAMIPNLSRGSGGRTLEESVEEIITLVGLKAKDRIRPAALTQGDLKLLELARALATHPELLLLDEPFAGLSMQEIEIIISLVQSLHRKGLTIIIVEHKLRELMRIVKRALVLNFGEKIADGSPAEVTRNSKVIEAYLGVGGGSLGAA